MYEIRADDAYAPGRWHSFKNKLYRPVVYRRYAIYLFYTHVIILYSRQNKQKIF